jgi:transposase
MNAYSKDLRLRVLAAVDRGMPRKEVVKTFGVSSSHHRPLPKTQKGGRESGPKTFYGTHTHHPG